MKNQIRILSSVALIAFSAIASHAQSPAITLHPQSQRSAPGSNVTFTVGADPVFPTVSSGTLRLWLKADAGVITNSGSLVSQWQDQSGFGNHASQSNSNLQPALVYPAAIGSRASVRFDGIQNSAVGDYLQGTNDVAIPDAFTSFLVYSQSVAGPVERIPAFVGVPGVFGASRGYYIAGDEMKFATWGYDYGTGFIIPTNTYRIWTDRFNTNKTLIELFDTTATTSTNINRATSGQSAPGAGYYVGGFSPITAGRNFSGDIAELIYFRGSLSDADRIGVENYLKQKYYQSGSDNLVVYQWRFNGTNIAGATNSSLTLTNVQPTNEGYYSVIVSNSFGPTASSNALLTLSAPPIISTQPQSQEVAQGTNLSFSASASGAFSLSYQWQFNGAGIIGATNSTLSLTNVQPVNAGIYSVVINDGISSIISSNAILTVDFAPTIIGQPQGRTAFTGANVSFSVAATGHPLSYQWFFNVTNPIAGATSASLVLTNVTTNNAGSYSVVVSNNLGSAPSSNAMLTVINAGSSIFEDFEPGIHTEQWTAFGGTVLATNYGGFVSPTHSLWMGGTGSRFATTRPIDVSGGGSISFYLRIASDRSSIWEAPELPSEGIVFEYSLNGTTWTNIGTYNTTSFWTWTLVQPALPAGAQSSGTLFRWRQLANSGPSNDHWALDDIQIVPASSSPAIVTQPQSQTVPAGTNLTLNVLVTGQAPLSFQWLLNSGTVLPSTSASLTLTNVQLGDSGNYSVVITNSFGAITSATAIVTVLTPPSISSQPQSQSGVQGTNVLFSVTALGSEPLNYQWRFNGVAISNANASTLVLTNIQGSNAGAYSVRVSNPVGSVISSNASLTIDTLPAIVNQPQSQSVIPGVNVSFSVGLNANIPTVSSGTLRLWLKADAGVITNANGFVNQWQDQSGNANHASQNSVNQRPLLISAPAIGGRPTLRFDGIPDSTTGDYLQGTNNVGIPDAFTSFIVYSRSNRNIGEEAVTMVGVPLDYHSVRAFVIYGTEMGFSAWGNDYLSGFNIPPTTYRVLTERLNTNKTQIEYFDTDGASNFTTARSTSGLQTPASGYYVAGLGSQTRNFAGDISELIYFNGSLSEPDRNAVEGYLKQKYYQSGSAGGLTFQWRYNGTNIVGATNSSLTLSNVQPANAGNYSVVVSNTAGSTTSADAILTVNIPPSITTQPQNQSANAGSTANFSVVVAGTEPLSYQWQRNSNNLAGATNATLSLNSVQTSEAGNYRVIVSSPFGNVTSSNAALTVNISTVRVISTNAASASTFVLPIELNALGTENAVGFTLSFDPSILMFESVTLADGLSGAVLISNTGQLGTGKLGIAVGLSANSTFTAGTQALVQVTFHVGVTTSALNTPVNFTDSPTTRQISDAGAETLPATFIDGTVAVSAVDFEGDVTPRPNGNRTLTITDWVQVGRFAAGLDTPAVGEFRRADCAPRADLGNGVISVTDWVQAGRYATGLDPLTPVGGPAAASAFARKPIKAAGPIDRTIMLETTNKVGQTFTVSARLIAQGNENAIGFSLSFDSAILTFTGATAGGNASGALLNVNSNSATAGRVGVALSLSTGNIFPAGTQEVIKLTFVAATNATGTATLTFTDTPVLREVSDPGANSLSANFANGSLVLSVPGPLLTINMSEVGAVLSWPASASNFVLETSSNLGTNWTTASGTQVTNAQSISTTLPTAQQQQFYRLKQP